MTSATPPEAKRRQAAIGAAVLVLGILPGGLVGLCRDAIVKALTS